MRSEPKITVAHNGHTLLGPQGVPIRLELGPKDLEKGVSVAVRRDTGAKTDLARDSLSTDVPALLETIQADMLQRARDKYNDSITVVENWSDFVPTLNKNHVIVIPWCESEKCEDAIKDRSAKESVEGIEDEKAPSSGAKSLCIPHDQTRWGSSVEGKVCPQCGDKAKRWTLFGRSCEFKSSRIAQYLPGEANSEARAELTIFFNTQIKLLSRSNGRSSEDSGADCFERTCFGSREIIVHYKCL